MRADKLPGKTDGLKIAEGDPQLSHRGSSSADLDRGIVSEDDGDGDQNERAASGIIATAANAGTLH